MNFIKINILFILLIIVTSCSQDKKTADCDAITSEDGILSSNSYDCPTGDPSNDDIVVTNLPVNLKIEAGSDFGQILNIKNNGDAKIFDFEIISNNIEVEFNSCPSKFNPDNNCSIQFKINKELSGPNTANILIKDRTGKLNKSVSFDYEITPSYPETVDFTISDTDFKTKRVIIGPLIDRFGNKVTDTFNIDSSRNLSNLNIGPFNSQLLQKSPEPISGLVSFFIQTDQLESDLVLDTAEVTFSSPRIYNNGTVINKELSLSFLNNKPKIDDNEKIITVTEDSVSNLLFDLTKGQDARGLPLSYRIIEYPESGVLSNCLNGNTFISLVNCRYSPAKDFNGEDFFTYKVNNGEADSINFTTVKIIVTPVNDAPVLSGSLSLSVDEKVPNNIQIITAFDPDGDSLSYIISQNPTKGIVNCTGTNCIYTPTVNMLGSDTFKYKARDPNGLESSEVIVNLTIRDVNEPPVLGGSQTVNLNENETVNFTVAAATDPDAGDVIKYKIKTNPTKGKLSNCLNNDQDLSCTFVPNKYENTADFFTYVAYDSGGLESSPRTVTLTINQINSAPYFTNLYQEEQTLANVPVNFTLQSAIDPENNSINYARVTDVSAGILANCIISGNNVLNCQYTPPAGVNNAEYSFTYRAQDSSGAISEIRTVKIVIKNTNNIPQLTGPLSITGNEDAELSFNLIQGTDTETPQSALRYQIGTVTPQNGTLSSCMNLSGSEGSRDIQCLYKPNEDYFGTDSFSYYVIDGRNNQSVELLVSININPINDAPSFELPTETIAILEDAATNITLVKAEDVENNPITYRIKSTAAPASLIIAPSCFINYGASNGCLITPSNNYTGQDSFIIEAIDSLGAIGEIKYIVDVEDVNDAPVLGLNAVIQVDEDSKNNISLLSATDIDTQSILIEYELVAQPQKGIISGCLGVGGNNGINCVYQSKSNQLGSDTFSYRAFDGDKYSNTTVVTVNINSTNDEPFFEKTKLGPFKVERGTLISFDIEKAKDVENDPITYEITTNPTQGVIESCFVGTSNIKCNYRPNEESSGLDSIVYRARDSHVSLNSVQVDFLIEDKRTERIYRFDNSSGLILGQRQALSVDKNIYELDDSLLFNSASSANNYSNNQLFLRRANGTVQALTSSIISNKSIVHEGKLYSFEETGLGNKIKIIDKLGAVKEVSYDIIGNIFFPISYNKNIYTGGNNSTLYKLNLLAIENTNLQYLEPIVTREKLNISAGKIIETLGVFDNDLFFTYVDNDNFKKIAKINIKGELTLISEDIGLNSQIINNVFYYENPSKSIKNLYFSAGSSSERRLFAYDLIEKDLIPVPGSVVNQTDLTIPQLMSVDEKEILIYYNPTFKKVFGLQVDIGLLFEYTEEQVNQVVVSKDKKKLVLIKNNNELKFTTDNPLLGFLSIPGLSVEKIYSFFDTRFLVKRVNSSEVYSLDEQNAFTQLILPVGFIFNDNYVQTNSGRAFFYSPRTTPGGQVFEFNEYKPDLIFNLSKNSSNTLFGLVPANAGGTYSIVEGKETTKGALSSCLGIGGINGINCTYVPNAGVFGRDSFTYRIRYSPTLFTDYQVTINTKNKKPEIIETKKLETFANIKNLGINISEYTVSGDEIYFTGNIASDNRLYRFNKAEGLRLITSNSFGYSNLKVSNGYVYFIDRSVNNSIKSFDINSKTIQNVFQDTTGTGLLISDIIIITNELYIITKNYGLPPSNRLIKFNLSTASVVPLPIPTGYENGRFIPSRNNSFYIETTTSFALFDKAGNVFIDTTNFTTPNQPGLSQVVDSDTIIFSLKNTSGSLRTTTYRGYSMTQKRFVDERVFNFIGKDFNSAIFPTLHDGGSLVSFIEVQDVSTLESSILLFRNGVTQGENSPKTLSGPLNFNTKIKDIDGDIWYISRDSTWNNIVFKKYGINRNYFALNNAESDISVPPATDDDGDVVSYEIITNPTRGVLDSCLIDNNDNHCNYIHSDLISNAVVDNFSYRAFDGFEYSATKTINMNIKNSPPQFNSIAAIELTIPQTVPTNITLNQAIDLDNNSIFYIITQIPSKGTISNCSTSINQLNISSRNCQYVSNSGATGTDVIKYRAYDGLSFSEELSINITISNSPNPVFLSTNQDVYLSNSSSSFVITLEKALDPQNLALTYQIVTNPQSGIISNCFVLNFNKLQCTYTPNNANIRTIDQFSYIATNGTFQSLPRVVKIATTASSMTGALGSFHLTIDGPILIKEGLNNISSLQTLAGYNWNNTTKILTLPANREYQFESFKVDPNVKIQLRPFNTSGVVITTHGWTKFYSQSSCLIDGEIAAQGGQTIGTSIQTISDTGIDVESLSYIVQPYSVGVKGGTAGSSSQQVINPGEYGTPTIFKSANGQVSPNSGLTEALGGSRGKDGLGIFFKCLDEFEGSGRISTNGEKGQNGFNGINGYANTSLGVSFGGGGGGGGGNGGQGGAIRVRTLSNSFNGNLTSSGGDFGFGGLGGFANLDYFSPIVPEDGTDGLDGINGIDGSCQVGGNTGILSPCL
jgi:hypothetical protein